MAHHHAGPEVASDFTAHYPWAIWLFFFDLRHHSATHRCIRGWPKAAQVICSISHRLSGSGNTLVGSKQKQCSSSGPTGHQRGRVPIMAPIENPRDQQGFFCRAYKHISVLISTARLHATRSIVFDAFLSTAPSRRTLHETLQTFAIPSWDDEQGFKLRCGVVSSFCNAQRLCTSKTWPMRTHCWGLGSRPCWIVSAASNLGT